MFFTLDLLKYIDQKLFTAFISFHGAMTARHETQCTKCLTVLRVKDEKRNSIVKVLHKTIDCNIDLVNISFQVMKSAQECSLVSQIFII